MRKRGIVAEKTLSHLNRQSGSIAVECALTLPLLTLLVITIIQSAFICIEGQLTTYATFMAARSQMVGGDYQEEAHRIVPWVQVRLSDPTTVHVQGHRPLFNVGPLGNAYQMSADMPFYPHAQGCAPTDDNPIRGGAGC